jgi:hypothetical protein
MSRRNAPLAKQGWRIGAPLQIIAIEPGVAAEFRRVRIATGRQEYVADFVSAAQVCALHAGVVDPGCVLVVDRAHEETGPVLLKRADSRPCPCLHAMFNLQLADDGDGQSVGGTGLAATDDAR